MAAPKSKPRLFDRLQSKEPTTRKVPIPLSDEAVQTLVAAEQKMRREDLLEVGTEETRAANHAAYHKALTRVRETTEVVRVQSIDPQAWDALQLDHPATEAQKESARKDFGEGAVVPWNTDSFLPAAWAACQVAGEPEDRLSEDECAVLLKTWNQGQQHALLRAIQECNTSTMSVDALGN